MIETTKPVVSVLCVCYNHARYLRQALDSVLCQKTDFPFEIVIHDDASTDGSQEIIREYEKRYPHLFVPILQTENQYSKGVSIRNEFLVPRMRGEFAIVLECDDFWCDDHKLQKQVDALRQHPECTVCVHTSKVCDEGGTVRETYFFPNVMHEGVLDGDEAIRMVVQHGQFHTSSRLIRAPILRAIKADPPEWMCVAKSFGDLPMLLFCATQGSVFCYTEPMTCYRLQSVGSYSERLEQDMRFFRREKEQLAQMWALFEEGYPPLQDIAAQEKEHNRQRVVELSLQMFDPQEFRRMRRAPYREYYRRVNPGLRLKAWLNVLLPWLRPAVRTLRSADRKGET